MLFEIKSRWTGDVLFKLECGSLRLCVEAAVRSDADLRGADLRDADLRGADLTGADLTGAVLRGADLRGADLRGFRNDLWAVLSAAPAEAAGLLAAVQEGRINGSAYEGTCACLVGTIANVRGCRYDQLADLAPDSGRLAEVWFLGIKPGDTPATNERSKYAAEWIAQWRDRMRAAFGHAAI